MRVLLFILFFPFSFSGHDDGKELLNMALDRCEHLESLEDEVVSKRWHNLFYILQFCYIFFWLCCSFLMHLATSCYIPIISGYK